MALVNEKKKFIFFHLYKCGGNSFRELLNEVAPNCVELQGGHGLPSDLKHHFDKTRSLEEFDEFYKFTIVRNPFDFMVSTYFYAKSYSNHFMHDEVTSRNMTMKEFIPYYMNVRIQHTKTRPFGSNKVVTIKDWLHDEDKKPIMDFIGKLETIDTDLEVIFNELEIPLSQMPIKNVNPNRVKNYRQYYTPESKAMIEKYFAWELNEFEYKY
jgi:chondroitin 4-sulfotransferase 11